MKESAARRQRPDGRSARRRARSARARRRAALVRRFVADPAVVMGLRPAPPIPALVPAASAPALTLAAGRSGLGRGRRRVGRCARWACGRKRCGRRRSHPPHFPAFVPRPGGGGGVHPAGLNDSPPSTLPQRRTMRARVKPGAFRALARVRRRGAPGRGLGAARPPASGLSGPPVVVVAAAGPHAKRALWAPGRSLRSRFRRLFDAPRPLGVCGAVSARFGIGGIKPFPMLAAAAWRPFAARERVKAMRYKLLVDTRQTRPLLAGRSTCPTLSSCFRRCRPVLPSPKKRRAQPRYPLLKDASMYHLLYNTGCNSCSKSSDFCEFSTDYRVFSHFWFTEYQLCEVRRRRATAYRQI